MKFERYNISYAILCVMLNGLIIQPANAIDTYCSDIDCDCKAIPHPSYQDACRSREKRLKSQCNPSQPVRGYCSLHGPSARPVAVDMHPMNLDNDVNVNDIGYAILSLYKGSFETQKATAAALKRGDYRSAVELLRSARKSIDSLFLSRLTVAATLTARNESAQVQSLWLEYSKEARQLAKVWYKFSNRVAKTKVKTEVPGLMMGIYTITAKLYEHSGYIYAQSAVYSDAAKVWGVAADISKTQSEMLGDSQKSLQRKVHINNLSAGRLHRSSYYWLMENAQDKAASSVSASLLYRPDNTLLKDIMKPYSAKKTKGETARGDKIGERAALSAKNEKEKLPSPEKPTIGQAFGGLVNKIFNDKPNDQVALTDKKIEKKNKKDVKAVFEPDAKNKKAKRKKKVELKPKSREEFLEALKP